MTVLLKPQLIGIDPGLDGATVLIDRKNHGLGFVPHSAVSRHGSYLDAASYMQFARRLADIANVHRTAFIEGPSIRGGQAGLMTVCINWGIVKGVWDMLGFNLIIIHSNIWKPVMVGVANSKKHGKQSSCLKAKEMGYTVPTHAAKGKVLHDGVADAILIAEFGGRKLGV